MSKPKYCRPTRPPLYPRDQLGVALFIAIGNQSRLLALCNNIVRRGLAPVGWQDKVEGLVLETRATLQMLDEQIANYWPDETA